MPATARTLRSRPPGATPYYLARPAIWRLTALHQRLTRHAPAGQAAAG